MSWRTNALLGVLAWIAMGLMMMSPPTRAADVGAIGVARSGDGASILLHERRGPCTGAARMAEHVDPAGKRTTGCWLMTADAVLISFLDGERGDVPVRFVQWVKEI